MKTIVGRIWKWVIAGVAVGALLHGFVPDDWFARVMTGAWWNVPVAVVAGMPLYTNVTGIVPVMEGLLAKGLPLGTTLAFAMSTVGASFPEFVMLPSGHDGQTADSLFLLAHRLLYDDRLDSQSL